MARNRPKKALYEVISKSRLKTNTGPVLEPLHPEKDKKEEVAAPVVETAVSREAKIWWTRIKLFRLNSSRIEISLPYQLVIALALGLILLLLVAFRLGQIQQKTANTTKQIPAGEQTNSASPAKPPARDIRQEFASFDRPTSAEEQPRAASPQGDHVIVLVQFPRPADLVPVREHFAQNGIDTEIIQEGSWYVLVTKNRYQNPNNPGTDGYRMKQKIIEVGAKYKGKAPRGLETFSPHFFRDAYGKKAG